MAQKTNTIKDPNEFHGFPQGIYPMADVTPAGVFSTDSHENLIKSKGFRVKHYRHALNPNRATPSEGVNLDKVDLSGYKFYDPLECYIVPQGLSWDELYTVQGIFGKHTITVNFTGYYSDQPEKRVYLRPDDILVAEDDTIGTVLCEDLVEWKPSLPIKCKFPVQSIDYLADADYRYEEGRDFVVRDGLIYWNPNAAYSPRFDNRLNKGIPLSIVYWTKPYYVVVATPRLFRMAYNNTMANAGQPANLVYYPGQAVVMMSWINPAFVGFDWLGIKL